MNHAAESARGISTRAVEIAVAAAVFALGAVVVVDSLRLGAKWAEDGPQAGYFPFYVGLIICLCAVSVVLIALRDKNHLPKVFVTWSALTRVMQVLGPALVYVLAIQFVGIYIASAAYIAIFMVVLGGYSPLWSGALGLGVMTAFFLMFEVWFKVPLYKGMFDPLAFLGY